MKRAAAVLLQIVLPVLALVLGPACGASPAFPAAAGTGTPLLTSVPRELAVDGCVFLDVAAMRDHAEGLYAVYEETFQPLGSYGTDFAEVDRLAAAGLGLFLLEGRLDLPRIREELQVRDYVRMDYLGVEVWESRAADFQEWVAFVDAAMLAGNRDRVIDCVEVMVEDADSLPEHRDIRGVVERLPAGLDMSVAAVELMGPLLAHGESLQSVDETTMRLTVVHKYADDGAAEAGARDIERETQELLGDGLRDVRVEQEGQFVTLTASVDPEVICGRLAASGDA